MKTISTIFAILIISTAGLHADGKLARLLTEDAQGTDGTDPSKIVLIYEVVQEDGFVTTIKVPKSAPDLQVAIKEQTGEKEAESPPIIITK